MRRTDLTVAVGTGLSGGPTANPSVRNYRTGLLAQVQRRFTPARTDARGPARLTHRFRLCVRSTLCWPRSPRAAPFPPPSPQPHSGLVRRLRRYYEAVRLPTTVHLGRAASAFPERPAPFPVGGQSWDLPVLAHEESAHAQVLRPRGVRWQRLAHNATSDVGLPPVMTTSAPRFTPFRGSIAGLCVPLSNASLRPRRSRKGRGRDRPSGGPRTIPSVRTYRTGLLAQGPTPVHSSTRPTHAVQHA